MNIEIANRLINLRKEKGFTQESLADALGISRQAVSKWERAEASPDTDNLICLAKLYGVSLDELLKTDQSVEEIKEENFSTNKESINQEENGIIIKDKDGSTVNVNSKGVHIVDKNGDTVHVGLNGIKINGKGLLKKENTRIRDAFWAFTSLVITIAYLILGACFNLWHPAWILFLLVPVIPSIYSSIAKRKMEEFNYPVLVTAIYLFLGCMYSLWHPYWVLFVTIPVYYSIVGLLDRNNKEKNESIVINNNNKEEDD